MKRFNIKYAIPFIFILLLVGCEGVLDIEPKSELSDAFLATESGLQTVLNGSYQQQNVGNQDHMYRLLYSILTSQIAYGRAGTYEQTTGAPCGYFTWNSNQQHLGFWWEEYYLGIRNANIVIDQIAQNPDNYSEDYAKVISAEAKALRGFFYYQLYVLFGPVPIFTSSAPEELEKARATDAEMLARIEQDLTDAAVDLPLVQEQFGRITKGGALGMLTKFYLQTKQWQKAVDAADDVIALDVYGLVPEYDQIYAHDNEENEEAIWTICFLATGRTSHIIGIITPPDFPLLPSQRTFAARTYAYDWFMDTFDPADKRKDLIVTSYVSTTTGDTIQGYGNNQSVWMKYTPDPECIGVDNGIDFMKVRYADILMSKAEAQNELSGPTQASIDLINQIRNRAGVTPLQLSDFTTKEALRDHILMERLWEFYFEDTEREDLLRMGKFISNAVDHGITNAKEYHKLFPIPQPEVNANSKLVQNTGY